MATNLTETFGLGTFPIYVPAGTLLPFQPLTDLASPFPSPLIWVAFPDAAPPLAVSAGAAPADDSADDAHASVYEDEGDSLAYDDGATQHALTNASFRVLRSSAGALIARLTVDPTAGRFPGMPSTRAHWLQVLVLSPPFHRAPSPHPFHTARCPFFHAADERAPRRALA